MSEASRYAHPGPAWTEYRGQIWCDVCWDDKRRRDSEGGFDMDDYLARLRNPLEMTGYINPAADDACCVCGVVAGRQHADDEPVTRDNGPRQ